MGVDLAGDIRCEWSISEKDIRTYAPLTLAYIGDAIYELVIRSILVEEKDIQVNHLHKRCTALVNAAAQRELAETIMDQLTETEHDFYRRGRNAKSYTVAKNASVADYRAATGLEALCGYLYLTGQTERLLTLLKFGLKIQ